MPSLFFLSLMNGAAWGGSEELWFRTALQAAANGEKVGCAFYYWPEKIEKIDALKQAGCQVYLLPNNGRSKKNLIRKVQYKISKWRVERVIALLPFRRFDLTVVNLGGFEIYTSTWKSAFRQIPSYVLLFHNYDETAIFKASQSKRLLQWITHAAANFFAASRIMESLEVKLGTAIPAGEVFINPVTIAVPAAAAEYPTLKEPFIFLMLAELDVSRKAQDNLVKALASSKWKARGWKLLLYGKGNDHEMLQQLIAKMDLSQKVFVKGFATDVKELLQQAHLVLQLTHRDAMPLAVMEAMAMARPLVVSEVGDMPVWVEEGHNGWVGRSASVEEIDTALERAWQQKGQWPQAGKKSFTLFKEKFPVSAESRFLQQLFQVIRSIEECANPPSYQ